MHDSYQASVADRVRKDSRRIICPECGLTKKAQTHNRTVIEKVGSFEQINPKGQLKYWDFEYNSTISTTTHPNGIYPKDVTPKSNMRVSWKCERNHQWFNTVNSQVKCPGCSICKKTRKFSITEKAVMYYVLKMFPEKTLGNYHPDWNWRLDLDIYIEPYKIAIQYDGRTYHNKQKAETDMKNGIEVAKHGIKLIRIKEPDSPHIQDGSIEVRRNGVKDDMPSLDKSIKETLDILSKMTGAKADIDVDCKRDFSHIIDLAYAAELENSISVKRPDLVPYISSSHNQNPDSLSKLPTFSNNKIWWDCPKCGMEHEMVIGSVTRQDSGHFPCKILAKKDIVAGVNDLAHLETEVMLDWDYERNTLDPTTIAPGSNEPGFWKCHICGHEWKTNHIYQRTGKATHGCPQCYKAHREEQEQRKHSTFIMPYLYSIKNNPGITSKKLSECVGTTIHATLSMLETMFDDGEIKRVYLDNLKGRKKYGYWLTPEGESRLKDLIESGEMIPKMAISRKSPTIGVNDLVTWCKKKERTDLLSEWNYDLNGSPEMYTPGDDNKVGWICSSCGHMWDTSIVNRTGRKTRCPICQKMSTKVAQLRVLKCINENPKIAASNIAKITGMNLTNVTRILEKIINENLAIHEKLKINERSAREHYTLTDKGIERMELIEKLRNSNNVQ